MSTVSCPGCQTAYPFQPASREEDPLCQLQTGVCLPQCGTGGSGFTSTGRTSATRAASATTHGTEGRASHLAPMAAAQPSMSMWDDVPALLPSEGRSTSSFSANAAPIYRGETRGPSLPCGHVPPQFGEVVVQAYYRTPAWKAVLAAVMSLILAIPIAMIDRFAPENLRGSLFLDLFYDWMPSVMIFTALFIAVTSIFDHLYPRVIAVTGLGIYLPASAYWWGMRFVPFSAVTRWGVELKTTPGGSYYILTIYSDVGKYYVNQAMFSSKDEYEEFTHTLHRIFPGRL